MWWLCYEELTPRLKDDLEIGTASSKRWIPQPEGFHHWLFNEPSSLFCGSRTWWISFCRSAIRLDHLKTQWIARTSIFNMFNRIWLCSNWKLGRSQRNHLSQFITDIKFCLHIWVDHLTLLRCYWMASKTTSSSAKPTISSLQQVTEGVKFIVRCDQNQWG